MSRDRGNKVEAIFTHFLQKALPAVYIQWVQLCKKRIYQKEAAMTRMLVRYMVYAFILFALTGCGGISGTREDDITVVSREDGSGTRGAFTDLLGIEKIGQGTRKDLTTKEAIVVNKTAVMLNTVAGDKNAIGYASLGSLDDHVKVLKINGYEPSDENIAKGLYPVARPFLIATRDDLSPQAQDFIDFILSKEGQELAGQTYIAVDNKAAPYKETNIQGKVTVAGSSSVAPLMEKLKEGYNRVNPGLVIEIQMSDSTSGISSVMEGAIDIGMVSRDLRESEANVLKGTEIAIDGIAIIINPENKLDNLEIEGVGKIFTGEYTNWRQIHG